MLCILISFHDFEYLNDLKAYVFFDLKILMIFLILRDRRLDFNVFEDLKDRRLDFNDFEDLKT